jgi:hypothetical protein
MTHLPQSRSNYRSPRLSFADITPAVLRLPGGHLFPSQLETVSLTGGLLSMSSMLARGSCIKLMFLTRTGPVLGAAEMLSPVSTTQQPFRFVTLEEGDQRRLRVAVQSSLDLNPGEQEWVERYRATLVHRNPPRRGVFRVVLRALTLVTLCLGSAMYDSRSICRFPWWYSMGCLGWWCLDARQK